MGRFAAMYRENGADEMEAAIASKQKGDSNACVGIGVSNRANTRSQNEQIKCIRLRCFGFVAAIGVVLSLSLITENALGQQGNRKPRRASPPKFDRQAMDGVFFPDVSKHLLGDRPDQKELAQPSSVGGGASNAEGEGKLEANSHSDWNRRIDARDLEAMVKGVKRRLDAQLSTPAKFAGGGYKIARREFALLAVLMGVIEQYSGDVRWKPSAPLARTHFARTSNNCKVGTTPAYNEAKMRSEELSDLLSGKNLSGNDTPKELVWQDVIDRSPLMDLLEWSLRERMLPEITSLEKSEENRDAMASQAALVDILGEILLSPEMPDAKESDYAEWTREMIQHAQNIRTALKLQQYDGVGDSVSKIDATCTKCHENYR